MSYVNTGVYVANRRPATKSALRAAIAADPQSVYFDGTDAFGGGAYTPDTIPEGVNLSVTGPDPYTARKWYATVTRNAAGKVTVK